MRERERHDRDRDRERERDRERDRDRDKDRERRYHSKSPARSSRQSSKPKKKKSKKSKKYYRRSRSSSRSSRSSSPRSPSSSRSRHSKSRSRDYNKSRSASQRTTRAPSSESNSRSTPISSNVKGIDLLDTKVQKALEKIDEDTFKPSAFFSTKDREAPEKVIIDLKNETVTVPKPVNPVQTDDVIFHPSFLGNPDLKTEKWIRKLYVYRQKYIQE